MPPVLRGEMLLDRMAGGQARLNYEQLRKDAIDLELQIKQLQVLSPPPQWLMTIIDIIIPGHAEPRNKMSPIYWC